MMGRRATRAETTILLSGWPLLKAARLPWRSADPWEKEKWHG